MFLTVYITVADYWNLKKDEILTPYKNHKIYETIINRQVLPQIGMLKVSEVTETDIEKLVRNFYDNGGKKSAVKMMCSLLRKIFHMAAIDRLVKDEICDTLKPIKADPTEKRAFTVEQETALLISFQKTNYPEFYTLLMLTGLNCKELSECKLNDYSRENKTLTVTRKIKIFKPVDETHKTFTRVIQLSDIACAVIDKAIEKRNSNDDFIFEQMKARGHEKDYKKIRKGTGIFDFQLKDLSANFGVHALRLRENPTVLKYYMGYLWEGSVDSFATASHNNVKDIQACDDYYRRLKDDE